MPEITPSKYMVQAGWDDVPHLDEQTKKELLAGTPPHLREARSKGIPSLGAGAIYPIPVDEVECKPFPIPRFWKKGYALDVGWNRTAALWGAEDPSDGTIYIYAEHYRSQAEPIIHAGAIKARGDWIKGAIDPAARNRAQADGKKLLVTYQNLGLDLVQAENAVESGLYECWIRLSSGRLKIFSTCQNFWAEYRLYRRDENGKIVKKHDHLMDDMRYLVMTWDDIAAQPPAHLEAGGSTIISDTRAGY